MTSGERTRIDMLEYRGSMIIQGIHRGLACFDGALEKFFAKKWHWFIIVPAVLLILLGGYFAFCFTTATYVDYGYRDAGARVAARAVGGIVISLSLLYVFIEAAFKTLTSRKAVWAFLVIASTLMALWGYQNSLNLYSRHHDSGSYGGGNHWTIIYDIYTTHEIPPVNLRNQYYQPKLYHAVIATLMTFNGLFLRLGDGPSTTNEAYQAAYPDYTITAYHSLELTRVFMIALGIASFYAIYRIFTGLGLKGKKLAIITAITILIPEFFYVQLFLNNDGFALAFSLIAFALALQFKKTEGFFSIVFAAITLGLGMMAKLNAALLAIPMAIVFLYIFVDHIKNKKNMGLLLAKFAFFAVIVFPLGLWVPISYKIRYDMPLGYVLDLTPTQEDKNRYFMYINPETYNFFLRCIAFPTEDFFYSPFNLRSRSGRYPNYVDKFGDIDFNCWTAFFKTGMFDEWGDFFQRNGYFATSILIVGLYLEAFLALLGIFVGVFYVVRFFAQKRYQQGFFKEAVLIVIMATYVTNYIIFVNRYPVGCSQNARYIMPLFLPIQAIIGSMISDGHDALLRFRNRAQSVTTED